MAGTDCDDVPDPARIRRPSSLAPTWASFGADDGIRTRDPHLGKVMLYQLSHVRVGPHSSSRPTGTSPGGTTSRADVEPKQSVPLSSPTVPARLPTQAARRATRAPAGPGGWPRPTSSASDPPWPVAMTSMSGTRSQQPCTPTYSAVQVGEDRHVDPDPFDDRVPAGTWPPCGPRPGTGEVGSGHVGHDQIEQRSHVVEQSQVGDQSGQPGGHRRDNGLGPAGEHVRARRRGSAPWPLRTLLEMRRSRAPGLDRRRPTRPAWPTPGCPARRRSSSVRTDTGTMATSEPPVLLPSAKNERMAPDGDGQHHVVGGAAEHLADPRTSASGSRRSATRRWGEMARLIEVGVPRTGRGAPVPTPHGPDR